MIRAALRILVRVALVVGTALALFKVFQSRRPAPAPQGPVGRATPPASDLAAAARTPAATAPTAPSPAEGATASTDTVAPAAPARTTAKRAAEPWVDPNDTECPKSHPVKAKLASGIYHLPGMVAYERTRPDRCYCDEDAAEGDGLRKAKR